MKSRSHRKKQRKSRKKRSFGGMSESFRNFFEQFNNLENQTDINNLISDPNNHKHVNHLLLLCYYKLVFTNHQNEYTNRAFDTYRPDVNMIENPVDIIIKLMRAPPTAATGSEVLTFLQTQQPRVNPIKFFDEIVLFMRNTNNINNTLIHLIVSLRPKFFLEYLRVDGLTQFPEIVKMFLEEYASGHVILRDSIPPILAAYMVTNDNNVDFPFDYYVSLLERFPQHAVFFYAIDALDINRFEQLFNAFNPEVNMPLPLFNGGFTMLDRAVAFQRNQIAQFLIDRGATISDFAIARLLSQPRASAELLEHALLNGATLPENARDLIMQMPDGANRNRKLEIVNNWNEMMTGYTLSNLNSGRNLFTYGLDEFKDFLPR